MPGQNEKNVDGDTSQREGERRGRIVQAAAQIELGL
jgi:hypothetical protein